MEHTHIDILGIERSYPHLIGLSRLLQIIVILRHSQHFITRLMRLVDHRRQFLHLQRTVVVHTVLIIAEFLHQIHKHLRISVLQLLLRENITIGITRSVGTIHKECVEIIALVLLGIFTTLQDSLHQGIISLLVNLGMVHQILKQ